jgi:hypothetical protein
MQVSAPSIPDEDWSSSVEEAKSMEKQIVLSEISVHQEQAPERSVFFPAAGPDALAEAMMAASSCFDEQRTPRCGTLTERPVPRKAESRSRSPIGGPLRTP